MTVSYWYDKKDSFPLSESCSKVTIGIMSPPQHIEVIEDAVISLYKTTYRIQRSHRSGFSSHERPGSLASSVLLA